MHGRSLPPIAISEFAAEVLEEAIEFQMGRLKRSMNEERDKADRQAWALAACRRNALRSIWSALRLQRDLLGSMLPDDCPSSD
ncbi:hypothetical protein, partial [Methylobacterium dankookense]|uniref:hypothetical protein n=1 Tax=Methylobacterium dankookense TaxID=560405 RepID=UPI001EDDB745